MNRTFRAARAAAALVMALVLSPALDGCDEVQCDCIGSTVVVHVTSSAGAAISPTITGGESFHTAFRCDTSGCVADATAEGTFTLQVTAPDHEPAELIVTITRSAPGTCCGSLLSSSDDAVVLRSVATTRDGGMTTDGGTGVDASAADAGPIDAGPCLSSGSLCMRGGGGECCAPASCVPTGGAGGFVCRDETGCIPSGGACGGGADRCCSGSACAGGLCMGTP